MICGKNIFQNKADALTYINIFHKKGGRKSKKLPGRVYFCHECSGFHVMTENKKSFIKNLVSENHQIEHKKKNKPQIGIIIHDPRKFKIK